MENSKTNTLIVAGGGTGGHVHAGLAVAEIWKKKFGTSSRVLFVGAHGGLEESLVPMAGFPLYLLKLGTLNRVSLGRKILTLLQLPIALCKSLVVIFREKPAAVLGVGGYASGPLVLMAALSSFFRPTKVAILEQNSVLGLTNSILQRFVRFIFAAFPIKDSRIESTKVVVTGNPVRSSLALMDPADTTKPVVFIFGGSQGAVGVNSLVVESLQSLGDTKERVHFIHQTGPTDLNRVQAGYQEAGVTGEIVPFIHDMESIYRRATVIICRAGSSSLAELAAVGRAAILIPLPTATGNHQVENARLFEERGAAKLLLQGDTTGKDLASLLTYLLEKPEELHEMERQVRCFYRPHAALDIVDSLSG